VVATIDFNQKQNRINQVSFMNEAGKETKGFMLTKEIDRQ